jgi:hypothetical protein
MISLSVCSSTHCALLLTLSAARSQSELGNPTILSLLAAQQAVACFIAVAFLFLSKNLLYVCCFLRPKRMVSRIYDFGVLKAKSIRSIFNNIT